MAPKDPRPSLVPAQGVPSGGNGKYILIAALLIGVVGALVAWKSCQKPEGPVATALDASIPPPPPPTKNPDDDIPPPPVIEDSGPPDAGKKPSGVAFTGSQCEVKTCTGTSTSEIETALAFRAKQSHRCYDNALSQDPTLKGKMSIALRLGANGTTCSVSVTNNELKTAPTVAACVVSMFRTQPFPVPKGGCLDANIPLNFVPR